MINWILLKEVVIEKTYNHLHPQPDLEEEGGEEEPSDEESEEPFDE